MTRPLWLSTLNSGLWTLLPLLAAPASAAQLLVEITHQEGTLTVPDPVFRFGIGAYTTASGGTDASPLYHSWSQADLGTVVHLSPAQLSSWRTIYADPTAMLQLDAIFGGTLLFPDQFFSGANLPAGVSVTSYLPQRGPALTGYTLADVSQTLTQFEHTRIGENNGPTPDDGWRVTHVVRFYVFVPEPSSAVLLLVPLAVLVFRRRHG